MTKINFENKSLHTFDRSTNNPFKFASNSPRSNKRVAKSQPTKKMYRQGDILFQKIETLPIKKKIKVENVIAEGEASGHFHLLNDGALFEAVNSDYLYIKANESTRITHDEHLPINLESGNYRVIRQREYLGEGLKNIMAAD